MTHPPMKYAVYQLIQGHPALIASDLSHSDAGRLVDENEGFYMCSMEEWESLKDYVV